MTEAEWLTCTDPQTVLEFLRGRATDRKVRLFACACCRLKWAGLTDQASRAAVAVAEKYADGAATPREVKKVRRAAYTQWRFPKPLAAWHAADLWAWEGACAAAAEVAPRLGADRDERGMILQCDLLRDIFGNPFGPMTFDPSWRSDTAVSLARQMYESREFSTMPILADALMDAGCDKDDVLNHCRSDGPHVRGCWVIDLLLGKE